MSCVCVCACVCVCVRERERVTALFLSRLELVVKLIILSTVFTFILKAKARD